MKPTYRCLIMIVALAGLAACAPKTTPSLLSDLHHKCYSIRGVNPTPPVNVDFKSQFTREQANLGAPLSLCAPVIKNTHGTLDSTYLKCYSISGGPVNAAVNLKSEQFGEEVHDVGPAISVCAPANKAVAPNKPTHSLPRSPYYTCYMITGEKPDHAPVTLRTNQFPLEQNVVVNQPLALCAPSIKDPHGTPEEQREKLRRTEAVFPHLKCYGIADQPPNKRVNLRTIFGLEQNVLVQQPHGLCVPVQKTLLSDIES